MRRLQKNQQIDLLITGLSIVLGLLPILCFEWFLTGDGPCHIYNASVTWQFINGNASELQKEFYTLNRNLDPNWMSHFVLGMLLEVFNAQTAEKLFLSAYVILFILGFRSLILAIRPENILLLPLGALFIYHHVFQMGFYNFSFSIVFFFFIIAFWIRHHQQFTNGKLFLLSLLLLIEYFTHPVGLFLSLLCLFLLILFNEISSSAGFRQKINSFIQKCFVLMLTSLASVTMLLLYIIKRGTQTTEAVTNKHDLFKTFYSLSSLVTMVIDEALFCRFLAGFIFLILIIAIFLKQKTRKFKPADGFFIAAVILFLMYFNQPENIGGVGIVPQRLQFIPYLLLIIWTLQFNFHIYLTRIVSIISFVFMTLFLCIRMPVYQSASQAVEEYLSVQDHISDHSVVLPLSFSHNGKKPNGEIIAERTFLFTHASDYMGVDKDLIMLGNYEANTGWFPLNWNWDKNPFWHLTRNEGIEFQPPCINLQNFEDHAQRKIDYIITWCLDDQFKDHPYSIDLQKNLDEKFELIYSSSNSRAKLYRRVK